ncbi:MAG TPA: ATP-binding protein [Bryobacteraceae bacterium]|nr:ATP-binding protein [Bryobacteraceae bacterium]
MIRPIETQAPAGRGAEDELPRLNARLARSDERRAIELGAARAEVDSLAHTISHDLRSPLTVISGFAELLAKHSGKALDRKSRHYLDLIKASTAQAVRMLDEMLALSRISLAEMHCVPVDLADIVNRAVQDLDASRGDRRVIWLIGHLPTIQADPTLLRQAITSLMFNALKFTRSREVARIQIGVQDGDHELTFFIRDNGAGLDLKHRERMFSTLQGPQSLSEVENSTIGWTHVQRIIQRHGGRTWMEAVPDGGAIVHFSIPDDSKEPEFRSERI